MPAPTVVGTPVTAVGTTVTSQDVTITVPSGANGIFLGWGSFATSSRTVSSCRIDPTGGNHDMTEIGHVVNGGGTTQHAGAYRMFDDDPNWPGTGSLTIRLTMSGSMSNITVYAFCVQDIDVSGTPINGTAENNGSSGAVTDTVTSTTNALDIGFATTYSADVGSGAGDDTLIEETQRGASNYSTYCWSEAGAATTNTVESNNSANVSFAQLVISLEGDSGGGGGSSIAAIAHHYARMKRK